MLNFWRELIEYLLKTRNECFIVLWLFIRELDNCNNKRICGQLILLVYNINIYDSTTN